MYVPQEHKIIPGGLNLLAPGDSVSSGDCLDLTNLLPSTAGRIQQTFGLQPFTNAYLGVHFNSISQGGGHLYFAGDDGNLYRRTPGVSEGIIDTGYNTTYPIGMISMHGYQWIINGAKQKRDNGTVIVDWTPAPPGAPTLTNPDVAADTLSIVTVQGGGLPDANNNYTRIYVWTTGSIAGIEPGAMVTLAGTTDTRLDGTFPLDKAFEGAPPTGSLLMLIAAPPNSVTHKEAGTLEWRNPSMPTGDQVYLITWVYDGLGESNPSPPTTVTVDHAGTLVHVDITALTPPTDALSWSIYRQSPGMAGPYLLKTLPVATKTYDDYGDAAHTQDNDFLVDSVGIQVQADHGGPPPARIMADQLYNGRVVVANSVEFPNRVWYTPPLQPGFFKGADNPQGGDWVDVGTDREDEILYLAVKPNSIIVYRQRSIWRILGDFQDLNGRIDPVVPDMGTVGPRAVVCTSLGDYFRGPENIYKWNGDWAQPIAAKLEPIFTGKDAENFLAEAPALRRGCALGFSNGRLWVSYASGGAAANSNSFVYHVATDRWFARDWGFGAYCFTTQGLLAAGDYYCFHLENGYIDVSQTICAYQSAYENVGLPDHEKTWADLVVTHNTIGQDFKVRARTNRQATPDDTFDLDYTLNSSDLITSIIPLVYPATHPNSWLRGKPIRSRNLSIRIDGNGPNSAPGMTIDTPLILHYYLEARQARTFDTDETDHGMPGVVKAVDRVEFDIETTWEAGATLQIYSDVPGGTMQPRGAPISIKQTTGRAVVPVVLPAIVEGKLMRYAVASPTPINLYGLRVRLTPIGVYIDGSNGETWDTRPIPLII